MTMMVDHRTYPLGKSNTRLDVDDYEFLNRFLDATKANLFFARALIVVEGDAENLLLPAIADKIGRPLSSYGVSLVNVGHRGLFRYSRIFQRRAGEAARVPVALIADRDIPPKEAKHIVGKRKTEDELDAATIEAHMQSLRRDAGDPVEVFVASNWTLEFDLALQPKLAADVHLAVQLARTTSRDPVRIAKIRTTAAETFAAWLAEGRTTAEIAVLIYQPVHDKVVSKTVVAEQLAAILCAREDDPKAMREILPPYLVRAIDYVTGGYVPCAPAFAPEDHGDIDDHGDGDGDVATRDGARPPAH
jgi:putative ATP-dependent endonuclease of OLD family